MRLLTVVFLILLVFKLAAVGVVATWPWWLVTLPLWIGLAIGYGTVLLGVVLMFFAGSLAWVWKVFKRK